MMSQRYPQDEYSPRYEHHFTVGIWTQIGALRQAATELATEVLLGVR